MELITLNDEMMAVKQLPIIEQNLKEAKEKIIQITTEAVASECTEATYKDVKKKRAELSKIKTAFEDRRKQIKEAVLLPYESFETVYNDCIKNPLTEADKILKEQITVIEEGLKIEKALKIEAYFNEYAKSQGISFLSFAKSDVKITLSASEKSLKEACKAYVDKVVKDVEIISTQPYMDEILYEYRQSLSLSDSMKSVTERHTALDEQPLFVPPDFVKNEVAHQEPKQELQDEPLQAPVVIEEDAKVYCLSFKVKATKSKLKELKKFLDDGGYDYE